MLSRVINFLEESIISLLLAAMTLLTFVQVVLRYVFNTGFLWHLEVTSFLFLWMVMLGIPYGIRVGSHIGVDIFLRLFSAPYQRIIGFCAVTLGLVYACLMFFGSYNAANLLDDFYWQWQIDAGYLDTELLLNIDAEDIAIKTWVLFLVMPIGFALLILRILYLWIDVYKGKRSGFILANEARDSIEKFSQTANTETLQPKNPNP